MLFFISYIYGQRGRTISSIKSGNELLYFYNNSKCKAKGNISDKKEKIGKWEYFDSTGTLIGIAHFSDYGQKTGEWTYYENNKEIRVVKVIDSNFGMIVRDLTLETGTKIPLYEVNEPLVLTPSIGEWFK